MNQGDPKLLLADEETYLTTVEAILVLAYDLQHNCDHTPVHLEAFFEHRVWIDKQVIDYPDYKFFKSLFLQKVKQEQAYEEMITDFYYYVVNRINEVLISKFKICLDKYKKAKLGWDYFSGEECYYTSLFWEETTECYFDRYTLCEGFIVLHRGSFPNETKILTPPAGSTLTIKFTDGKTAKPVMIEGFQSFEADKILQAMFNKAGMTDIVIN